MVHLNDDALDRMMHAEFQRRVNFGVPKDIVHPYVSSMMRDFIDAYSAAGINLVSSISRLLLTQIEEGRLDVMLTTEPISTG